MPFHGLVDVHGVHTRGVEAGEPHVAHDDELEQVGWVFEALFQALLDLAAVDVRAQQRLVAGATGHDDFDGALLRVVAVPVRAQFDDFVVQVHANLAAHGHGHGFAVTCLVSLLEVRHQVGGHALDTRLCADHLLQGRPAALEFALDAFFFVLGQFVHLVVYQGQLGVFEL